MRNLTSGQVYYLLRQIAGTNEIDKKGLANLVLDPKTRTIKGPHGEFKFSSPTTCEYKL